MSLCDTCKDPGHCCREIPIWGIEKTTLEVIAYIVEQDWPFEISYIHEDGRGRYECRNLLPNGRCGDYENRPFICSDFVEASDRLCCHYMPTAPGCDGCREFHQLKMEKVS